MFVCFFILIPCPLVHHSGQVLGVYASAIYPQGHSGTSGTSLNVIS